MKFRQHIKAEHGLRQFDIAPLIDVVFILLTFFMLTSSFVLQPGIKIDLPSAYNSEGVVTKRVTVAITAEDVVYLNNSLVTDVELEDYLIAEKDRISSVFIQADRHSTVGRIVSVWDVCKKAGLSQVNIATTRMRE
jgi:biopolymer transport protein ExbD